MKKNINQKIGDFIMKRTLSFIISLFMISFMSLQAQTYYYKQISLVDANGVKSKGNERIRCLTFVNKKATCYWSDKNGNKADQDQFIYERTTNNKVHVYTSYIKKGVEELHAQRYRSYGNYLGYMQTFASPHSGGNEGIYTAMSVQGFPTYMFSGDFSRLNIRYTKGSMGQKPTEVWVRVSSPVEEFDDTMY